MLGIPLKKLPEGTGLELNKADTDLEAREKVWRWRGRRQGLHKPE